MIEHLLCGIVGAWDMTPEGFVAPANTAWAAILSTIGLAAMVCGPRYPRIVALLCGVGVGAAAADVALQAYKPLGGCAERGSLSLIGGVIGGVVVCVARACAGLALVAIAAFATSALGYGLVPALRSIETTSSSVGAWSLAMGGLLLTCGAAFVKRWLIDHVFPLAAGGLCFGMASWHTSRALRQEWKLEVHTLVGVGCFVVACIGQFARAQRTERQRASDPQPQS
jgi:hypothetical protein